MKRRRENRVDPWLLEKAREMRHEKAPAEEKVWRMLRDRQLNNFKFRQQHPVGTYNVDFYCAKAKLIVELDGDSHSERKSHDEKRTRYLMSRGTRVIRFENPEVFENLEGVPETILTACESKVPSAASPSPLPSPPSTRERGTQL